MVGISIPIMMEGGRQDLGRRGSNKEHTLARRGSGCHKNQLVKRSSRTKLKTFQIEINLEPEPADSSADPSSFKTKPQFLKRRSVQKIGVECDPCEKKVRVNSDCVKHVKLGHEGSTFPRVLTRRQSSGRDLLGLAKTQTGMTRALTRRQSGGRQDLLGLDQRRNSCGKTGTQREARNALRLASKSGVEIDKENTSTLNRLSAISIGNGEDQDYSEFERSALLAHNKYRIRHGVCLLKLDRKLCTLAQDYAGTLAATDTFQHSGDPVYGENLYWGWSSDPGWELPGGEAVESWYEEKKGYNYSTEPEDTDSGHFTQMIWAQSRHLGVGLAKSPTTGKFFTVMKYDPAGNYTGKYRENVFRPANCGGKKILDM
eukprot:TRINITY_DN10286_c0_g1_i5.p1 TRINITY_DN10286_c0_g1~~TRINITY_DN10286_c0_g1_i5.p1  ORF type:complete len:372 (-),score=115.06 TRINITY_DN10286_c0_g1_i5:68-1183(-)